MLVTGVPPKAKKKENTGTNDRVIYYGIAELVIISDEGSRLLEVLDRYVRKKCWNRVHLLHILLYFF